MLSDFHRSSLPRRQEKSLATSDLSHRPCGWVPFIFFRVFFFFLMIATFLFLMKWFERRKGCDPIRSVSHQIWWDGKAFPFPTREALLASHTLLPLSAYFSPVAQKSTGRTISKTKCYFLAKRVAWLPCLSSALLVGNTSSSFLGPRRGS